MRDTIDVEGHSLRRRQLSRWCFWGFPVTLHEALTRQLPRGCKLIRRQMVPQGARFDVLTNVLLWAQSGYPMAPPEGPLCADFVDLVGQRCVWRCPLLAEADVFVPAWACAVAAWAWRVLVGFFRGTLPQAGWRAGGGSGLSLASFLRFWAVAASRNSSWRRTVRAVGAGRASGCA